MEFKRNSKRLRTEYKIEKHYLEFLDDLGMKFQHPVKPHLTVHDIFVYPECKEITMPGMRTKTKKSRTITAELMITDKKLFFAANEKAGKTTLSKKIFIDFHAIGIMPLYLNGSDCKNVAKNEILRTISDAVTKQYGAKATEKYLQLSRQQRVVIIDDYDKCRMVPIVKNKLLELLENMFDIIVLLGSEDSRWEELLKIKEKGGVPLIAGFKHYEILQFGPVKRSEIIEKWLTAGFSAETEYENFHKKMINAEDLITQMVGNNIVPSYPMFILLLMQQIESSQSSNIAYGAQGYLVESLIVLAIAKPNRLHSDIDIRMKYLTNLSYLIYKNKDHVIPLNDMKIWHDEHCETYLLSIDFDRTLNDLCEGMILEINENEVRFKYPYIRYYFTAKYIAENIENDKIKELIDSLAIDLHRTESANIMIFLAFVSKKDKYVLEKLLETARNCFKETEKLDIGQPPEFLNLIRYQRPEYILRLTDLSANRKDELKRLEKIEEEQGNYSEEIEAVESEVYEVIRKMNISVKVIQILGQVLRSYPGTLTAKEKLDIAIDCYDTGLRLLGKYAELLGKSRNDIAQSLVSYAVKLHPDVSREVLSDEADSFIYAIFERVSFSVVKHISV